MADGDWPDCAEADFKALINKVANPKIKMYQKKYDAKEKSIGKPGLKKLLPDDDNEGENTSEVGEDELRAGLEGLNLGRSKSNKSATQGTPNSSGADVDSSLPSTPRSAGSAQVSEVEGSESEEGNSEEAIHKNVLDHRNIFLSSFLFFLGVPCLGRPEKRAPLVVAIIH